MLEGLEETFTVNRMDLTPSLIRSLATTNLIENPHGAVRRVSGRVHRYRDADMAMRWAATGFLEAEKRFRKLGGANTSGSSPSPCIDHSKNALTMIGSLPNL
ncbi:MAG: hypothetical protein GAK41_01483 [Burkholderia gladioli]|nr:MAG: hypothetical protein GAK41_01483 [Burkholderia gladioli]